MQAAAGRGAAEGRANGGQRGRGVCSRRVCSQTGVREALPAAEPLTPARPAARAKSSSHALNHKCVEAEARSPWKAGAPPGPLGHGHCGRGPRRSPRFLIRGLGWAEPVPHGSLNAQRGWAQGAANRLSLLRGSEPMVAGRTEPQTKAQRHGAGAGTRRSAGGPGQTPVCQRPTSGGAVQSDSAGEQRGGKAPSRAGAGGCAGRPHALRGRVGGAGGAEPCAHGPTASPALWGTAS